MGGSQLREELSGWVVAARRLERNIGYLWEGCSNQLRLSDGAAVRTGSGQRRMLGWGLLKNLELGGR